MEIINTGLNLVTSYPQSLSGNKRKEIDQRLEANKSKIQKKDEIFHITFENLRELNLSGSDLQKFPHEIKRISELKTLNLSFNRLSLLPESLDGLSNLEALDVSHNNLTEVPNEIERISKLIALNLSCNQLAKLPESLGGLHHLETLDVSHNKLHELPECFFALSIKKLYIQGNQTPFNYGKFLEPQINGWTPDAPLASLKTLKTGNSLPPTRDIRNLLDHFRQREFIYANDKCFHRATCYDMISSCFSENENLTHLVISFLERERINEIIYKSCTLPPKKIEIKKGILKTIFNSFRKVNCEKLLEIHFYFINQCTYNYNEPFFFNKLPLKTLIEAISNRLPLLGSLQILDFFDFTKFILNPNNDAIKLSSLDFINKTYIKELALSNLEISQEDIDNLPRSIETLSLLYIKIPEIEKNPLIIREGLKQFRFIPCFSLKSLQLPSSLEYLSISRSELNDDPKKFDEDSLCSTYLPKKLKFLELGTSFITANALSKLPPNLFFRFTLSPLNQWQMRHSDGTFTTYTITYDDAKNILITPI